MLIQELENSADDPAVDTRYQVVSLGRGQKYGRRDNLIKVFFQPEQDLVMTGPAFPVFYRYNRLCIKDK